MRAYPPHAVKSFYDLMIPKRKRRTASESSMQTADLAPMRKFVMDHFVGFTGAVLEDGSEPDAEQQRSWLSENEAFQERIFRMGYDRVGPIERPDEALPGKAILLFGQRDYRIPLEFHLYSHKEQREETIRITAVVDRLTQSDKHQYDKAVAVIENSRRGEVYTEANWDVIELLCNQRLKRLEGNVLIDGKLCMEENKEQWLKRLPFIPKVYIIAQCTTEIDLKNA